MTEVSDKREQNILLYNREKIILSGISSVDSFNDAAITATTRDGDCVTVEGSSLNVRDVNLDKGVVEANGNISGFFYHGKAVQGSGFFGGLFKRT